jgi:hypothetical protein
LADLHQILVSKGLVSEQKVIKALEHQLIYGGRIGTNLVELGYVRLDDLGRVLALQLGVRYAEAKDLESIDPRALGAVDPAVCVQDHVIPLRIEGNVLHLAMADPRPEHLVALASRLGLRIVPYIVPELRLFFYLERHFNFERPGRYLRLPEEGPAASQRRHYLTPTVDIEITKLRLPEIEGSYQVVSDSDSEFMVFSPAEFRDDLDGALASRRDIPIIGAGGPELDDELIFLDERSGSAAEDMYIDTSAFAELEASAPSQVPFILRSIEAATESAAITHALVAPLYPQAAVRLLFWVRRDFAVACRAAGAINRPGRVPELVVPIAKSLLFSRAFETKDAVRGEAAEDPLQPRIAEYVGAPPPEEIHVVPVLLSARTIHLLCIYSRAGTRLPDSARAELRLVSERTTAAYVRLRDAMKAGQQIPHL